MQKAYFIIFASKFYFLFAKKLRKSAKLAVILTHNRADRGMGLFCIWRHKLL